jgi:hypothetical protein
MLKNTITTILLVDACHLNFFDWVKWGVSTACLPVSHSDTMSNFLLQSAAEIHHP